MKNKILATVSLLVLMAAMPAMAETELKLSPEHSTADHMEEDAKEAWEDIKNDTSDAYEKIKATLIGQKQNDKNTILIIDSRKTAAGIIGYPVYNENHETVAKVVDIIIDKNGTAMMVVVADGAFIGMGKKAAFDYSIITRVDEDGDVIMPLTEKIIDNAAPFSYDKVDAGEKVRMIPDNGYSIVRLLDGKLVNQNKEAVADIDNISFKNGKANHVIVSFNKTIGLGGENIALSYSDAAVIRDGQKVDLQLNAEKTLRFEAYKKTVTK